MAVEEKDVIQVEINDKGVATVWLNRPHKRNCVSPQLLRELEVAVDRVAADKSVLAVVFRGRGNTFCSGADLDQLVGPVLHETSDSLQLAIDSARTYDKIYNMKKPTIAAVEGYAVAGGFELMISCDFAIAASEARIGDFHIRRALFGGAGPIYRLPRYIGMRKAKELMLTGKLLTGDECAEWGLCNASAPQAEFDQLIADFVQPFLELSPFCMWMTKMAVNRGLDADTDSLITLETMTCNVVH
ncbi:MAG: enoyl-CoA hydratase/isomerase family protein, partial [Sphingomonadales bacterium]|nr:enoyl-CoA hydratase/isomerase family protein [Sphingomonadales bacterium]